MSQTPPSPPHDFSRHKDLGALQGLLLTACPPDETGKSSIPALAKLLKVSNQYVYKWIDMNRVPPSFVTQLVDLGEGRVSFEDFHPYVFC